MLRSLNNVIAVMIITLLVSSCTSTRNVVYFYNAKDTTYMERQQTATTPIRPNDILGITVSSASPEASAMFNQPVSTNSRSSTATGNYTEAGGYLVGTDGNIQMPVLGNVKAAGLTEAELKDHLMNLILATKQLVDPVIEVRFLNFEVTVIGEVGRPTVITVPNEKISLLKALGLAGDLTIYGKRENVLLIREENGKRMIRHINLNSSDFFTSPYYYLQPNDVVYVQPNKARVASASRSQQLLPIIISTLSVIAIVIDRLVKIP